MDPEFHDFPHRFSLLAKNVNAKIIHQSLSRSFGKCGNRWLAISSVEQKVVELFAPRKLHVYFRGEKDAIAAKLLIGGADSGKVLMENRSSI